MDQTVRIRRAGPDDLPILQDIEVSAGSLFAEVGLPEVAAAPPPTLERLAAAPCLLVAVGNDEPVGYAWLALIGGQPHLEQLSVRPEHGGRGIGTALLDAAAAWAASVGGTSLTLTTFRDVPFNAPLYAKRGFVEVPEPEWTEALRALVSEEADQGLDPTARLVMRRPVA